MSTSFSANQYDNAFTSKKLTNWEVAAIHREVQAPIVGKPDSLEGFTQIIGNERGHLLTGVTKSQKNPWGNFVGTWDLPKHIPGNTSRVTTARTREAQEKLCKETEDANLILSGRVKNQTRKGIGPGCMKGKNSNGTRSGAENPGSKMFGNTTRDSSKDEMPSVSPAAMDTGRLSNLGLDTDIKY